MDDLQQALTPIAPQLDPGATAVVNLRRLSGGASQETWAFETDTGAPMILRRKPPSSTGSGNAVPLSTEAALIRAAAANGATVPRVMAESAPGSDIGEAYVMARLEGETLGKRIARDPPFEGIRPGLAAQCGKALAAIHAVPTAGLPDLVTSSALTELEKYEAVYRGSGAERPIFEAAIRFLRDRAPPLETPVLVHGDFRNGNIMVHPDEGLVGVLDWELAHLGDPAEDMGWICTRSWRFGGGKPVGGFGEYADLLDAYHGAGGRELTLERVLYWEMLGSLKWGCMCLTMYMAYASGADASVERAMIGRRASETEIDLVALLEQAS